MRNGEHMTEPALLLTVDYEIFGNGTGCVERCVLRPAERMMKRAEAHGAVLTFFVDALEFAAMEEYTEFEKAVEAVKKQLNDAISRGHDVQLHLHPQWLDSVHDEHSGWRLNLDMQRIADLEPDAIERAVRRGKKWLESFLGPHQIIAFRAGGWGIQPAENVLEVLHRNGIRVDTSVAPGMKNFDEASGFDFTAAPPDPACWGVRDDVCVEAHGDAMLVELPIATGEVSLWRHVGHEVLRKTVRRDDRFAPGCSGGYGSRRESGGLSAPGWMKKLGNLGTCMLDLTGGDAKMNEQVFEDWLDRVCPRDGAAAPVVAISHTKNFSEWAEREMERFLKAVCAMNPGFTTMRDWWRKNRGVLEGETDDTG